MAATVLFPSKLGGLYTLAGRAVKAGRSVSQSHVIAVSADIAVIERNPRTATRWSRDRFFRSRAMSAMTRDDGHLQLSPARIEADSMAPLRISAISFLNTAPLMWDFEQG